MPNLRLSDKEAADITAYLMSLRNDAFMARPRPPIDTAIRDGLIKEHLIAANVPLMEADRQLGSMDDHQRTLFVGEKTIGRYGCFGCHTISGFEKASPIGVELTEEGSKVVERLDFGFEEGRIPHTLPGWVHRKVMEPRVFDEGKVKHTYVRTDRYKVDYIQGMAVGADGSLYLMDIYPQLNVVCFPKLTAPR